MYKKRNLKVSLFLSKKYNYESYIDFKNWYKKIFNLELDSNDAFDHNFYEMEISLDDIDKNKEQIQLIQKILILKFTITSFFYQFFLKNEIITKNINSNIFNF